MAKEVFTKSRGEEEAERIKKLLNRFSRLNDVRKRDAHGLWVPSMEGGTVHYVSRGTLRNDRRTKQADDLEKAADEALSLRVELENAILLGDTPLARRK